MSDSPNEGPSQSNEPNANNGPENAEDPAPTEPPAASTNPNSPLDNPSDDSELPYLEDLHESRDVSGNSEEDEHQRESSGDMPFNDAGKAASVDPAGPLEEASLRYWQCLTEEELIHSYNGISLYYQTLLEEFRTNANEAVGSYLKFEKENTKWRRRLIIATGGLAILNVLAATDSGFTIPWTAVKIRDFLSICAAVYAASLALLTNLESFFNYPDKKNSTRESRELYLDAFRHFEMLRLTQVFPFGYSAIACYNFQELYRRLVLKDLELRRKIMQLSQTQPKQA